MVFLNMIDETHRNISKIIIVVVVLSGAYWPLMPGEVWLGACILALFTSFVIAKKSFLPSVFLGITIVLLQGNLYTTKTDVLYEAESNIIIKGKVRSLIQQKKYAKQFLFKIHQINGQKISWWRQPTIRIRWPILAEKSPSIGSYTSMLAPQLGETWRMSVKLKPIYGQLNQVGFDKEKYFVSQGLSAQARANPTESVKISPSSALRLSVYVTIFPLLESLPNHGYLLALSLGERSQLNAQDWQWLRSSGLAHLMAISGLHIGIAYGLGWWIGVVLKVALTFGVRMISTSHALLLTYIHQRVGKWLDVLPFVFALLLAVGYAWLAGFSLPTVRAVLMCAVLSIGWVHQRYWSAWHGILTSMLIVVIVQPFAGLSSGFWLSFSAVIVIFLFLPKMRSTNNVQENDEYKREIPSIDVVQKGDDTTKPPQTLSAFYRQWQQYQEHIKQHVIQATKMQIALFLGMSMVMITLFGGVSVVSPLVNFLCVPWVALVTVPLIFIALFCAVIPSFLPVSTMVWSLADKSLSPVVAIMSHTQGGFITLSPSVGVAGLALTILWLFRHSITQLTYLIRPYIVFICLSTVALWAWPSGTKTSMPQWRVVVLDVGQGLAILIEKNDHWYLYDTGPGWEGGSEARSLIIPWLAANGVHELDGLILSHTDLDHAGGMHDIEQALSPKVKYSSERMPGYLACIRGAQWQWQGLTFEVHWPPKLVQRAHNQHSCVISIKDDTSGILLTGDVDAVGEYMMLSYDVAHARNMTHKHSIKADVMIVPHHGSATSSKPAFIEAVNPHFAIASVSKDNQWHLPKTEIIERYQNRGIKWHDTASSGQVDLTKWSQKREDTGEYWSISAYRSQQYAPWYRKIVRSELE